ncbi:MAG: M1 family metallopeptidase [Bacteroidales bacterium]|nr:M1 family metallopeptidase [Bacteroidales bacterium]
MRIILLIFLSALFLPMLSQTNESLFIPKEMQQAYRLQTRDFSGNAGKNYWQNHANYKIDAQLIPESAQVDGYETIVYSNNSPDTLRELVFQLYQDIYRKGTSRDWDIGTVDLHDGVLIKNLKINGKPINLEGKETNRYGTLLTVKLQNTLLPKQTIEIVVEWSVKIPKQRTIRMGTYEDENFMVAYWFPRIAVYDDIVGWNRFSYNGNCEFYNDFSDFEVRISTPPGYLVWSSALLENPQDIYSKAIQNKLQKAYQSDSVFNIITESDWKNGNIFKTNSKNSWIFKMESVVDFAFAATNSYLWDATSVKVGEERIKINAVYKPNSSDFPTVAAITHQIIDYYSNETPGIPFPFPQMTAFNGRGGMEYPGMVNDGDSKTRNGTIYLTAHEVGHSYFPFNSGLNEHRWAWMDEGLISFFPRKLVEKLTTDSAYILFKDIIDDYNRLAGSFSEIPLMIPATNTGYAYRFQAYTKSAVALIELERYLGEEKMNRGLQLFTSRWKGKHPTPYDFFFTFNEVAGEDLSWFWQPWYFQLTYADFALELSKNKEIQLRNIGGNPAQVNLEINYKSGRVEPLTFKADIWKSSNLIKLDLKFEEIKSVRIITESAPEANISNNLLEK